MTTLTMEQKATLDYPVVVSLPEKDAERVKKTNQPITDVANYLVGEYARGGIMLPAERVQYLSAYCSTALRNSDDVMQVFESAAKRRSYDGSLVVQFRVDGSLSAPLEEEAKRRGQSVESIVNDAMYAILMNGWFYSIQTSGGTITLSAEQRQALEQAVGTDTLSGDEILRWARSKSESGRTQPPPLPKGAR